MMEPLTIGDLALRWLFVLAWYVAPWLLGALLVRRIWRAVF